MRSVIIAAAAPNPWHHSQGPSVYYRTNNIDKQAFPRISDFPKCSDVTYHALWRSARRRDLTHPQHHHSVWQTSLISFSYLYFVFF